MKKLKPSDIAGNADIDLDMLNLAFRERNAYIKDHGPYYLLKLGNTTFYFTKDGKYDGWDVAS